MTDMILKSVVLIAVVALLTGMVEAAEPEILLNGSFEAWEEGHPSGWTVEIMATESAGPLSTVARAEGRDGAGSSLALSGDTDTKQWFSASQEFTVEQGTLLTLSGWMRVLDVDRDGHRFGNCQITMVALDQGGQRMGIWALGALTGTTDWTRYEKTIQVPLGATRVIVAPFLTMSGTAFFDDISLQGEAVPTVDPAATPEERWRSDLAFLVDSLAKLHVDPFGRVSEEAFRARAAAQEAKIPEMSDLEIIMEMMALTAMLGDAHTGIKMGRRAARLPIQMEEFAGEVRVQAVDEACAALLGGRVVRLGDLEIGAALEKVRPIVPHENDSWLRYQGPRFLRSVDVLDGLGITALRGELPVTVIDDDGDEVTCTVVMPSPGQSIEFVAVEPEGGLPLYLSGNGIYRFHFLEESRTLYLKYDQCREDPERPIKEFTEEVLAELDTREVDRFVLDLRHNLGGTSTLLDGLIAGVAERKKADPGLECFVVTGARTFSSGTLNALDFRRATGALVVGEPMGNRPNHPGQVNMIELPYSRLKVSYSTQIFRRVEGDPPTIEPDLPAPNTWMAFMAGRDPVMEAILAHGED